MRPRSNLERRKNKRILTPSGVWAAWKFEDRRTTSRVQDFSVSGAFIVSEETVAVGARLTLLFSLPEGEIQVQAVVRSSLAGKGLGVEFVAMGAREFELILKAVKRLLE